MTVVGPQGAAVFHFRGQYKLKAYADMEATVVLVDSGSSPIDLSIYTDAAFAGAARRERNEDITTVPLFQITGAYTTNGTDGSLDLAIDGTKVGQDTPERGYYDIYGLRTSDSKYILLLTGRWECEGTAVNPNAQVADA